jgi:nicotinamidase-related amidase
MEGAVMSLSQLDERIALIVIDLQKGTVASPTSTHQVAEVVERAARLARSFRERGLPVVLVNVTGGAPGRTDAGPRKSLALPGDWAELVPELMRQPDDHIVTKQRPGAFIGTDLHEYLQRQGVTQVVLAGVATSIGVESTARSAYDHGYNVTLVIDAMTDRDLDMHRHCIEKIFPRLGETATIDEVLRLLNERP